MLTLARAKCPRCGWVISAASPEFRDQLARAHDAEVHHIPASAGVPPAADVPSSAASKPAIAPAVQPD
jgi:hypothetical protein